MIFESNISHAHTYMYMYASHIHTQNVTIAFIENQARLSGASIFASDMQQCSWLGNNFTDSSLIFQPPEQLRTPSYPFQYRWEDYSTTWYPPLSLSLSPSLSLPLSLSPHFFSPQEVVCACKNLIVVHTLSAFIPIRSMFFYSLCTETIGWCLKVSVCSPILSKIWPLLHPQYSLMSRYRIIMWLHTSRAVVQPYHW